MPERFPVSSTPDRPEFSISIGGAALEAIVAADVMEIDAVAEIGRHGRASLLVQNWDSATEQVRRSDDGPFVPGQTINISLGYHSELTTVFDGVISSLRVLFGDRSAPVMEVRCHTRSVLLDASPRSRWFEDITDEDATSTIASDYGLTADTAAGGKSPTLGHRGTTDWEFLLGQGARLGWVTYVHGDRLVHRPHGEPGATISLAWRTNLLQLELTQDLARAGDPFVATGWDFESLEVSRAEAGGGESGVSRDGRPAVATSVVDSGWSLRTATLASCRPFDAGLVDRIAAGAAADAERRHITGHGRCIGVPTLAIDTWLNVVGIGKRFGGDHYVTAVRHRLGSLGFHTEFQLGRPPAVAPNSTASGPDSRGPRPTGRAGGLALGVVADLDDPLQQGRVKVALPWQVDGPEAIWARLARLDAGDGFGTWFVPDLDQEVVVGYLEDDPAFPVVLGSLWNGKQAPPEQMADGNKIRAIVTPSGHQIRCDDGDPGTMSLVTAGGHRAELADKAGTITLSHSNGAVTLTLADGGATLEATKGDLTLSAPAGTVKIASAKLDVSSKGPAKVASSATLDLSAAATLSASGALVKLN